MKWSEANRGTSGAYQICLNAVQYCDTTKYKIILHPDAGSLWFVPLWLSLQRFDTSTACVMNTEKHLLFFSPVSSSFLRWIPYGLNAAFALHTSVLGGFVGFFLFVCFLTSCALSQSRLSHDCLLWERTVNLLFYKPLSGNQTLLLDAHDLSSLIYSCYRTCKWQCHCYEAAWSIIFQNPQPGLSCVKRHSGQMGFKTCVFPVAVKTQCTLEKQFFSFFFFLLSLMCNQLCDGIWAVLKVSGH